MTTDYLCDGGCGFALRGRFRDFTSCADRTTAVAASPSDSGGLTQVYWYRHRHCWVGRYGHMHCG